MILPTEQLESLKLARYEFRLRAKQSLVLYPLLGSPLRGAFGHAWKTLMCAAAPGERAKCFLNDHCQFPASCGYSFFKPVPRIEVKRSADGSLREKRSNIPCSYVFEPPIPPITPETSARNNLQLRVPEGGEIPFGLTLLDSEHTNLHDISSAVALLAKRGLGATRFPFNLTRISMLDEAGLPLKIDDSCSESIACSGVAISLDRLVAHRMSQIPVTDKLSMRFLTPVLLESGGRLKRNLSFSDLFSYLSRRLKLLAREYGSCPLLFDDEQLRSMAGKIETHSRQLWLHESQRFSDSRSGKLDQTGLLGEITFSGRHIVEFLPLVVAGEFLHVGSNTAFGLGRYEIIS